MLDVPKGRDMARIPVARVRSFSPNQFWLTYQRKVKKIPFIETGFAPFHCKLQFSTQCCRQREIECFY